MMTMWIRLLAQDNGNGFETILWVIAFLILSGVGALSEKFKKKKEESKRHWKPTKIEPPLRPAQHAPPRPVRPVGRREKVVPGAAPPARSVPRRVVPRPPAQERPQPKAGRHVQPTIRRKEEPHRRIPSRRRVKPAAPQLTQELAAPLKQLAQTDLSKAQTIEPSLAQQLSQSDVQAAPRQSGPGMLTSVRSMKQMSIQELRRAIVLSEVLRPPLALRELQ